MKKKVLVWICAAALLASGCSDSAKNEDSATPEVTETATATPTTTETPTATETPEATVSAEQTPETTIAENGTVTPTENVTPTPTAAEQPESTVPADTDTSVKTPYKLYELTYSDGVVYMDIAEGPPYCEIQVSNITDTSFDFEIYQVWPEKDERNVTFRKHTADFVGDGTTAVFKGNEYTLTFTFPDNHGALPDVTDIEVSGFPETEGHTYMTNRIPGHGFS